MAEDYTLYTNLEMFKKQIASCKDEGIQGIKIGKLDLTAMLLKMANEIEKLRCLTKDQEEDISEMKNIIISHDERLLKMASEIEDLKRLTLAHDIDLGELENHCYGKIDLSRLTKEHEEDIPVIKNAIISHDERLLKMSEEIEELKVYMRKASWDIALDETRLDNIEADLAQNRGDV